MADFDGIGYWVSSNPEDPSTVLFPAKLSGDICKCLSYSAIFLQAEGVDREEAVVASASEHWPTKSCG